MLSVIFAAAVAAASPPPAAAPNSTPAQPAAKAADPVICHMEAGEGTRITHKVCMRASDIAMRQADARWLLDRAQSGSQAPNMSTMVSMGPMH